MAAESFIRREASTLTHRDERALTLVAGVPSPVIENADVNNECRLKPLLTV